MHKEQDFLKIAAYVCTIIVAVVGWIQGTASARPHAVVCGFAVMGYKVAVTIRRRA